MSPPANDGAAPRLAPVTPHDVETKRRLTRRIAELQQRVRHARTPASIAALSAVLRGMSEPEATGP